MAQRYGRNQKRRAREQIAALEKELQASTFSNSLLHAHNSNLTYKLRDLKSEVEKWDAEIVRLLGTESALRFETPTVVSKNPIHEYAVRGKLSMRPIFSEMSDTITCLREIMLRHIIKIEEDPINYSRLIRFVESNGDYQIAYSISRTLLEHHGLGPRDEEHIARMIARQFVQKFNADNPLRKTQ